MSFATLSNIATIMFCIAVLVQSVRMMRCLRDMKGDEFGAVVAALDAATAEARSVLADLRETLRTDCAANARVIASGTTMREELTVMTGIADAVAERLLEAVGKSSEARPKPAARATPAAKAAHPAEQAPTSTPTPTPTPTLLASPPTPASASGSVPAPVSTPAAVPARPKRKPRSKPNVPPVQENPA